MILDYVACHPLSGNLSTDIRSLLGYLSDAIKKPVYDYKNIQGNLNCLSISDKNELAEIAKEDRNLVFQAIISNTDRFNDISKAISLWQNFLVINFLIMANSILEKQNEQRFIDMLSAQRHLYNVAKRWNTVQVWFCVIIVICVNFIKLLLPKCNGIFPVSHETIFRLITMYGVMVLILQNCLVSKIARYKLLAARIQQLFDCSLFQLNWSKALCGEKPQPEIISRNLGKEDIDKLYDWYSLEISPLNQEKSTLVCMRSNVYYDCRIRQIYTKYLKYFMGFILLLLLVVFGIQNTNLWDIVVMGIVPLLPAVKWLYDVHRQNTTNLKSLANIKSLLNSALDKARRNEPVALSDLEQIQNFIFIHRKTSFMIPSWVYYLLRKQSEKDMNYSVKQIVQDIL